MKGIGLRFAVRGAKMTIRRERNMRIHVTASFFVLTYAATGRVERWAWAALCLCLGLVMGLELINSSLERLSDRVSSMEEPIIGAAKDMAAGSVLMGAVASTGVAVAVFARREVWDAVTGNSLSYIALITIPFWVWFIKGKRSWKS